MLFIALIKFKKKARDVVEIGKMVMEYPDDIIEKMGKKYKINKIVGQYHSALEHTFLWIFDAEDPGLFFTSFTFFLS